MVNSFKQNLGKFQFIVLETNTDMFLCGNKIEKFQMVVPLPITIDDKLSALKRILKIFVKFVNYKFDALQRIRKYLSTEKEKIRCNALRSSQFYYVPIIWMFAGKLSIPRIQIHFSIAASGT